MDEISLHLKISHVLIVQIIMVIIWIVFLR